MKTMILFLATICVACGSQQESGDSDAISPDVLKAARIADAIQADPDRAEAVLAEHNLTAESFADLMYEIAADEKMSADFERSRKR